MRIILVGVFTFLLSLFINGQEPYYGGKSGEKLDYLFYYINKYYIDQIDNDSLEILAIESIVNALDPYSKYKTKEESKIQSNADKGQSQNQFGFNYYKSSHNTFHINYIHPNGPADEAGLKTGMKLVRVNGKEVLGKSLNDLRGFLKVDTLELEVQDMNKLQSKFRIESQTLKVASIQTHFIISHNIGYIKISHFNNLTSLDFKNALSELKKAGLQSLILDLRNNNGGVKNEALSISDAFIDGEKLLLTEEGHNYEKKSYHSSAKGLFETGRLIVLIDENTASASEILTAALQDWDRALIMGQASFGKGLIQQSYRLNDESTIRLTIAEYKSPQHRQIQRNGGRETYEEYLSKKGIYDISQFEKDKLFVTKNGRYLVKGNGGIYPDIFCNNKKSESNLLKDLNQKGFLYDFSFHYFLEEIQTLKLYQDRVILLSDHELNKKLMTAFRVYLKDKNYNKVNDPQFGFAADVLEKIKIWLLSFLFGSEDYYAGIVHFDPWVLKAIDIISDEHFEDFLKP